MSYKQNSPISEVEGGTGQVSYTTGDILYSSASNVLSKLAVGSNTEVLTLSSGVPSWAAGGGTGEGWEFISSVTGSTSPNLNFTSGIDSTYTGYAFVFENIRPQINGDSFNLRTSTNAGVSYDAGASDYAWNSNAFFDDNDDRIKISSSSGTVSSTLGRSISGMLILYNPSGAYSTISSSVGYIGTTGIYQRSSLTGRRKSSSDVDAIRFFMTSSNITSGTIYMYGMGAPS